MQLSRQNCLTPQEVAALESALAVPSPAHQPLLDRLDSLFDQSEASLRILPDQQFSFEVEVGAREEEVSNSDLVKALSRLASFKQEKASEGDRYSAGPWDQSNRDSLRVCERDSLELNFLEDEVYLNEVRQALAEREREEREAKERADRERREQEAADLRRREEQLKELSRLEKLRKQQQDALARERERQRQRNFQEQSRIQQMKIEEKQRDLLFIELQRRQQQQLAQQKKQQAALQRKRLEEQQEKESIRRKMLEQQIQTKRRSIPITELRLAPTVEPIKFAVARAQYLPLFQRYFSYIPETISPQSQGYLANRKDCLGKKLQELSKMTQSLLERVQKVKAGYQRFRTAETAEKQTLQTYFQTMTLTEFASLNWRAKLEANRGYLLRACDLKAPPSEGPLKPFNLSLLKNVQAFLNAVIKDLPNIGSAEKVRQVLAHQQNLLADVSGLAGGVVPFERSVGDLVKGVVQSDLMEIGKVEEACLLVGEVLEGKMGRQGQTVYLMVNKNIDHSLSARPHINIEAALYSQERLLLQLPQLLLQRLKVLEELPIGPHRSVSILAQLRGKVETERKSVMILAEKSRKNRELLAQLAGRMDRQLQRSLGTQFPSLLSL